MAFSATDAALEGFRITRAHPKAVIAWAGVQLVMVTLLNIGVRAAAGDELTKFASFSYLTGGEGPAEMMRLVPIMLEILAINLILSAVFNGVLSAAVNRAVRYAPPTRFGWLRLGPDEPAQILVLMAYVLILAAVYLVGLTVAVSLLGALFGAVLGAAGAVIGAVLGVALDLAAVVFVAVRLSLAAPATFATGRITLFETWPLTRGRFWPLAGAYCVSLLLALLVAFLVQSIGLVLMHLIPGLLSPHAETAGGSHAPLALTDPASLLGLVFSALAGGLTTAVVLAPAPYAYRQITGDPAHVDTFA
jgi:hypothetical protein